MPWDILTEQSEVTAIHAGLVLTAAGPRVVYFGGFHDFGTGEIAVVRLFNPSNAQVTAVPNDVSPTTNVFCGDHSTLSDGRLLVGGGTRGWPSHAGAHGEHYNGQRACWIYRPLTNAWVRVDDMEFQPGSSSVGGGRWYPTLVMLANGEVLAVGGHPDVDDNFGLGTPAGQRHNNNTPERYSPTGNSWTLLADGTDEDALSADNSRDTDGYPRLHLLPGGRVFFSTNVRGKCRFYNPYAGVFEGDVVDLPGEGLYHYGSAATAVLLPLLPDADGNCQPRILICGGATPMRIDPESDSPQWEATSARDGEMVGVVRNHLCACILPNGDVFVSGGCQTDGTDAQRDASSVLKPEVYRPGIDWATNTYNDADEQWTTIDEPANANRHYHSTTVLLPDGRVWSGGSNSSTAAPGDDGGERRIEAYRPDYGDEAQRPTLGKCPPSIGYDHSFDIETPDAASIERVALTRAYSMTHSFSADQRYVGLRFEKVGNKLRAASPKNSRIAPPGYYLLWIVDEAGRPCQTAKFVRVSDQKCLIYADRSTFSLHEVLAQGTPTADDPANFTKSFYLVLDGFLRSEIYDPDNPGVLIEPSFSFAPGVEGLTVSLTNTEFEDTAADDTAQRVALTYAAQFTSTDGFDGLTEENPRREVMLRVRFGPHECETPIVLTVNPNPFMRDGDVPWLSLDLRVFRMIPGESLAGVSQQSGAGAGTDFIKALLAAFNSPAVNDPDNPEDHPFLTDLTDDAEDSKLVATAELNGQPVFNYAVAKVRYKAPADVIAEDVRLFFRLFTTAATGLDFNAVNYPRAGDGPDAVPLVGLAGGEVTTVPFFADARSADPATQTDVPNVKPLQPGGPQETHTYFGCWLDFNREEPKFLPPLEPGGETRSIQDALRGMHQCLVAEIHYGPDPIPPNATPGNNENLAQRNLAFEESDNPGGPATHSVAHTFELKPSAVRLLPAPYFGASPNDSSAKAAGKRGAPDELMIHWNNVPRDSQATLYLPDVDVDEVLRASRARLGPGVLTRAADGHTLKCRVTDVSFIPLPGPRLTNVPGLLTIQLPPDVTKGQEFTATARQVSGLTRRIIGSFQLTIRVSSADKILPDETRKLSLLKHIAQTIPTGNRWYPIFERYLEQVGDRVRGLGGDPDAVEPSTTGSGKRPSPPGACCLLFWALAAIFAFAATLLGVAPVVAAAPIAAASAVLLVAVACYWFVRCRPSWCDLVNSIALGAAAAGAALGGAALLGYVTARLVLVLGLLAILVFVLTVAALLGGCCWHCCRDAGRATYGARRKGGRYP